MERASDTAMIVAVVFALLFTLTVSAMIFCIHETRKENQRIEDMVNDDMVRVVENHQYEIPQDNPRRESNFTINRSATYTHPAQGGDATYGSNFDNELYDSAGNAHVYDNQFDSNSLC